MSCYLHRTLPLVTADNADELGEFVTKTGFLNHEDGAYRLNVVQYNQAIYAGARKVDEFTFEQLRRRMNEEIEI